MEYFKQEKDYTCGCACVRMILSHFSIDVPTEAELEKHLKTDSNGTDPAMMIKYLKRKGYEVKKGENASLSEIQSLHLDGWVVILEISVDVPHFTVYNGHNGCHLKLNDPFFGQLSRPNKKFESEKNRHPNLRWWIRTQDFGDLPYDFEGRGSHKAYIAAKKLNV